MQICPELGHPLNLRGLLPEAELIGADDVPVGGCACDSRKVRPGDVFVAVAGDRHDGNDFVAEAVERGCAAVLSERPLFDLPVPSCVVPSVRKSYARLCQALAGNPSRLLKLIGVTGTNGKTTTDSKPKTPPIVQTVFLDIRASSTGWDQSRGYTPLSC